jgi:hypothetical protein
MYRWWRCPHQGREATTEKEGRRIYRSAETWDLASRDEEAHRAGTRP